MDNLILEGIVNNLYKNMKDHKIKCIHISTMVLGTNREGIPDEFYSSIKNGALTLNITPDTIGGITYNENGTFSVDCALKGKKHRVTLISSLLASVAVFYYDDNTDIKPFYPTLRFHEEDGIEFSSLTTEMINEAPEVVEKRSKMRVLS